MTQLTKPYVLAALVCDRVIDAKDGTLSLIRVVDQFTSTVGKTLPPGVKPGAELNFVIILKSPEPMSGNLTIVAKPPTAEFKAEPMPPMPMNLAGGSTGMNIVVTTTLEIVADGLYWFDVFWNDEFLSSIPITMRRSAPDAATQAPTPR